MFGGKDDRQTGAVGFKQGNTILKYEVELRADLRTNSTLSTTFSEVVNFDVESETSIKHGQKFKKIGNVEPSIVFGSKLTWTG